MKTLYEHSLSIVIGCIWLTLLGVGYLMPNDKIQEYLYGLSHDAFGALVIVIATKYFIERGSKESK